MDISQIPAFGTLQSIQWPIAVETDVVETSTQENSGINVNAFTLGYNQSIWNCPAIQLAAGAQATVNIPPHGLQALYGKTPIGGEVYLQVKPVMRRQ